MHDWTDYAQTIIGLLAIVNPMGAVPMFISLTTGESLAGRGRVARVSALAVGLIMGGSVWMGEPLLHFFGISIAAFRVAGGLLILLMAIAMLHARQSDTRRTSEEEHEAEDKDDVAVVPLAIPLMAGPGAISVMIVNSHQAAHWTDKLLLTADAAVIAAIVWMVLRMAVPISRHMGTTGINITTRLMGLILAAIGVEFVVGGLKALIPGLS